MHLAHNNCSVSSQMYNINQPSSLGPSTHLPLIHLSVHSKVAFAGKQKGFGWAPAQDTGTRVLPEPRVLSGLKLLTLHSTDPMATLSSGSSCINAYIYWLSFPLEPLGCGPTHTSEPLSSSTWASAGHLPLDTSQPTLAFSLLLHVTPPLPTSPPARLRCWPQNT